MRNNKYLGIHLCPDVRKGHRVLWRIHRVVSPSEQGFYVFCFCLANYWFTALCVQK